MANLKNIKIAETKLEFGETISLFKNRGNQYTLVVSLGLRRPFISHINVNSERTAIVQYEDMIKKIKSL
jgi:hypothetical protein